MPAEQLATLVDDPSMREALAVVFERTDGGSDEVEWSEVKDALSSGQWGRLIQEEVLVGGAGGFTLAAPDRVRRRLAERGRLPDGSGDDGSGGEEGIEPEPWTWYDKAAGAFALVFFTGYWNTGVRDAVASLDDVLLAPVTHVLPFHVVVLLLAVATGLYSTVLQGRLMDTEALGAYQERMNRLKERREAAKEADDEEALDRIREEQMEAAGDQLGVFKLQFRPMVWIMLLTVPVFLWLRWKVRGGHLGAAASGLVVPLAGAVSWQEPLLGPMSTWIVWYLLCSVAARQIIRKTFDIRTSPSTDGS